MNPAIALPSFRRAAAVALFIACLLPGLPTLARAAEFTNETGVRLLEIELLPGKVALRSVKCDPLVIAVSKATLAHPHDAVAILDAALTRRVHKLHDPVATLPCACARRIFLASVAAAPRRSSEFLDLALELYPDCAPEFAGALSDFNSQNYLTGTGPKGAGPNGENSPAASALNSPMGASMFDSTDPGIGDGGFGVGFGPGFPGSPGFTGSAPSGGIALPPAAVTSVLNG